MAHGKIFKRIGGKLSLTQQIEESVEEAIRSRRFRPGEKLPTELELCTMFGVSRTPLREALRNLRSKGLIQVKMGSGMYVGTPSTDHATSSLRLYFDLNMGPEMVMTIVRARRIFEPAIAEAAAAFRTDEDIARLGASVEEFRSCDPRDLEASGDIDHRFHRLIAEAVHNPVIPLILKPIYELPAPSRSLVYGKVDPGTRGIALDFHQRIFDAIRTGDGTSAREIMVAHLDFTDRNLRNSLVPSAKPVSGPQD
jgi:GntR family transcriptional regulator, transcriptional repressor for pyruvate dehydrogenase complex